ncbi:MAG: beta-lactamase family protein [Alphaproteobacteria bacterium]|nr:beta-lactamase family protein [Alphaproteobacteria bacterium]
MQLVSLLLFVTVSVAVSFAHADGKRDVYPGKTWAKAESPETLGWSREKLAQARAIADEIGSTAVMIVQHGVVIDAWGEIDVKSNLHSVRKSLLSGLIGIAVDKGQIDLSKTLADLGIDDNEPSLTPVEKQATVGDLIKARSGIYHPALYETKRMTASKPPRGIYPPGSNWHYNNWDFNALGTIYEQATEEKIFEAFKRHFGDPLQMQDYEVDDGRCVTGWQSDHAAYPFRMTARDLARFGLLFLRNGRWKDKQIVSPEWVAESTAKHSDTGRRGRVGYGYMWWTGGPEGYYRGVKVREHSYFAAGYRGQLMFVIPYLDLVIVHRANTDYDGPYPKSRDVGRVLWTILAAAGETID